MTIHTRFVTSDDLPELIEMISDLARSHNDEPQIRLHDLQRDMLGAQPWCCLLYTSPSPRDRG